MKKILSMLLAVCTLASFVTVASAAETPTMKLVAEKITFDGEYADYASDYDWSEYNADAVGGSYDTYSLKVVATGVEIKTEAVKSGKSTIYVGDSILGAQFDIALTTDASYDNDWKWGMINSIGAVTGAPSETGATLAIAGTTALEPAPKVAKTITKEDETVIVEFLVTVDSGMVIDFAFDKYILMVGKFDDTSKTPTTDYNYAYDNGTMTTTTATFTLPVADAPVDPEPVKPIDISDRYDLEATVEGEKVLGAAWNVTLNEYDSTKTYVANFTAGEETRIPREIGNLPAETEGSVSFAVLLKLNKARNVTLSIVEQ